MLQSDPTVVVFGEDLVDPYGGAFKVTKGLSTRFPDRVLSTPISESAIIGMAGGMAMRGLKPVVEIMFGDFLTLGMDQLVNHITKYKWMYNDKVSVPVVIRTPMGGGRGYGPTHSQSIEKLFMGIPGLRMLAVNRLANPGEILKKAINGNDPVLFIENKILYPQALHDTTGSSFMDGNIQSSEWTYPTHTISWNNFDDADATLVVYGGASEMALQAAYSLMIEEELVIDVVIPTQIKPIHIHPIAEAVRRSKCLFVLEEGTADFGWGKEVIYQTQKELSGISIEAHSIGAENAPIGSSKSLEDKILPQLEDVKEILKSIIN